jgi:hypothetical protein
MPHIHTDPGQHDLTASAYVVRLDTPEPTLMLHMHKKLHRYMQFGGHVELHETPWQAVIHELAEESGYELTQLKLLQPKIRLRSFSDALLHPMPISLQTHQFGDADHYHTDTAFAFVTDEPPKHAIKEGESTEFKYFTLHELRTVSQDQIRENVRETGIFVLEELLRHWQPIDPNRSTYPY